MTCSPFKPLKFLSRLYSICLEALLTVHNYVLLFPQTLPTTQYELEIVAKDMAGSEVGLTGTATATITITDRNDHAPEFTHSVVGGTYFGAFFISLFILSSLLKIVVH